MVGADLIGPGQHTPGQCINEISLDLVTSSDIYVIMTSLGRGDV